MATNFVDINDEDVDDDFWELAASYVELCPTRCPRVFRDRANPLTDLNDSDFRVRFRLTKQCFVDLLDILEPEILKC